MIGLLVLLFIAVIVLISIDRRKNNDHVENDFNSNVVDYNCDNTDQSSLESFNDNNSNSSNDNYTN